MLHIDSKEIRINVVEKKMTPIIEHITQMEHVHKEQVIVMMKIT